MKAQGQEKDFQLHTVGWKSFQDIACVVAEVEYSRPVSRLAKTSDQGRDGFFYGIPDKPLTDNDERQTTIQVKHYSRANSALTKSSIEDDLRKVKKLVNENRADGYILISNGILSEGNRVKIYEALVSCGVKRPLIYGKEWVEQKIIEHHKVRALVPRVYGLGDLGWITDERSASQAKAIIAAMGRDLQCYVPTEAHQNAVEALGAHRFVLLLGDPAVGKSSIAAALSIAATDSDDVSVFFVRSPEEFLDHWDPNLENRLFWIDDAFGSIQYKPELMDRWNKVFASIRAATDKGNRFVVTSRSYIWIQAYRDMKKGVFLPLSDGKVIVDVQNLTIGEKERILYNHLKYGGQSKSTLKKLVPFLEGLVRESQFRPEMARRLGDPIFTRKVTFSQHGVEDFFKNAQAFLADTIADLSIDLQAALGAIFVMGGRLSSPLTADGGVEIVLERFGVSLADLSRALNALKDSFVTLVEFGEERYWTFRHPTMADSYADIVGVDPELVQLYLRGVDSNQLLREAIAGQVAVVGSSVTVPPQLYGDLLNRLRPLATEEPDSVRKFLMGRTGDEFFGLALKGLDADELFQGGLYRPASSHPYSRFILRARRLGCLSEVHRLSFIEALRNQIENEADVDFLFNEPEFAELLSRDEFDRLTGFARSELIDYVESWVENEADNFDPQGDPDDYFDDLKFQLEMFESLFPEDPVVKQRIVDGISLINGKVEELRFKAFEYESYDDDYDGSRVGAGSGDFGGRSIFDDLAE